MSRRRTSMLVATHSREGSAVRRAPLAAASRALAPEDAGALARLVGHMTSKAAAEPGASKLLSGYAHALRKTGRGHLVALANAALLGDGGRMLRDLARLSRGDRQARERVVGALLRFVALVGAHQVTSDAALVLLLRSALQGVACDDALARLVVGKGTEADALTMKLDTSARLNLLSGLQVAREAQDHAGRLPTVDLDEAMARVRAHRDRAEREAAEDAAASENSRSRNANDEEAKP